MADEETEVTWWKTLLWGLAFLGLGALLFWYFSGLEESGRSGRIHWLVALIYHIGGKWTVAAVCGLISLVCFFLTYKQLRGSSED